MAEIVRVNDVCADPWSSFPSIKDIFTVNTNQKTHPSSLGRTAELYHSKDLHSFAHIYSICQFLAEHYKDVSIGVLYAMHIHKCLFLSDVAACACGQMP